jgi:1,4-dihydroxy-2-naphthoate polyprenyltransferase
VRKSSLAQILYIARPQFLVAGLGLFLFGVLWAVASGATFSLPRVLLAYLVLMPAHLSVSYSNDYFDVDVDRHGKPTLFTGGSGVLVDRPGLRKTALWVALGLTICSLILGVVYQAAYSFSILFASFVLFGNLLGWFYSAPPVKFAYRGLGELSMIFSIGFLVPGLGYLATNGRLDLNGLLFMFPLMLYGLGFILAVEIPDMEADRLGHKRTWVARKGRLFGFNGLTLSFLLGTLFFMSVPWLTRRSYPIDFHVLGIFSLLPLGAGCVGVLKRSAEKRPATRIVNGVMFALVAFCALADGYMIYLNLK